MAGSTSDAVLYHAPSHGRYSALSFYGREEQLAQSDNVYGRHLGIWWNYPVTDYMEQKLALGPVEHLPRSSVLKNAVMP